MNTEKPQGEAVLHRQLADGITQAQDGATSDLGDFSRHLLDEPVKALRDAAAKMRKDAQDAMSNSDEDTLCCWQTELVGGQERVIEVRRYPEGTDAAIVALPATGSVARHIAGMHPNVALALADHLDAQADWLEGQPPHAVYFLPGAIYRLVHAYLVEAHD